MLCMILLGDEACKLLLLLLLHVPIKTGTSSFFVLYLGSHLPVYRIPVASSAEAGHVNNHSDI